MRIRTKKWAKPELNACDYFIAEPKEQKGKWQEFFKNDKPIHLDLGCGKCTFMADLAFRYRDVNHIAVDISFDILGVGRRNISGKFADEKVDNVALCSYNIEQIKDIVAKKDKVERIYVNFCNPWPSSKCHKRRLTHTRQLEAYKTILADNGEIWFKTDNPELFLSSKRYFQEAGLDVFFITEDLNSETQVDNIKSEHEVMFESQGINTKAIRARMRGSNE